MNKEEIITHIGNDILGSFNIAQILDILKEDAVRKAAQYYESLNSEQQKELEEKIVKLKEELLKTQSKEDDSNAALSSPS